MKKTLLTALLLLLTSSIASAEVTRVECPAYAGVSTCYSLGNLDEAPLGISLTGSSCGRISLRSTAPIYFKDTYYFTLTKESNLTLQLEPRTTNRLRISIYTPTLEGDGVSALFNGSMPTYNLQQLAPTNYSVTIKGYGAGTGVGICGYRVTFN